MASDDDGWVAPVIALFGSGRDGIGAARPPAVERAPAWGAALDEEAAPAPDPSPRDSTPREKAAERAERRARNVSVAALARRGMSVAELRDRLAERGIEPDEAEAEIARLQDARYLDDGALAESVVLSETARKGRGRSAVAAELRRRRVDDVAIEVALEALDDEGELERAIAVATHRARQLSSYDPDTARRRLYGFLQRRGFSGGTIQRAVEAALTADP
jgi:regulatory protein